MSRLEDDEVYQRICSLFENNILRGGQKIDFDTRRYTEEDYLIDRKSYTPEMWMQLLEKDEIGIYDIPVTKLTREALIQHFSNEHVYKHIQNNCIIFLRQFYKDVIVNNPKSCNENSNVFRLIPIEDLDEGMISLGAINYTDWCNTDWFDAVLERSPNKIPRNVWALAARLYDKKAKEIVEKAPEEYKDEEFYKELCRCSFNGRAEIYNREKMDLVPKEMLTSEFLMDLFEEDHNNIRGFNEDALECVVTKCQGIEVLRDKLWKVALKIDGNLIDYIPLNSERVEYFKEHFSKDSNAYRNKFQYRYREYKRTPADIERMNKNMKTDYLCAGLGSLTGIPVDEAAEMVKPSNQVLLPSWLDCRVPDEYRKEYDDFEYLRKVYEDYGIKVLEEYNIIYYKVELPEGFKVEEEEDNPRHFILYNDKGEGILSYYAYPSIYDPHAYVTSIRKDDEDKWKEKEQKKKAKRLEENKNQQ